MQNQQLDGSLHRGLHHWDRVKHIKEWGQAQQFPTQCSTYVSCILDRAVSQTRLGVGGNIKPDADHSDLKSQATKGNKR